MTTEKKEIPALSHLRNKVSSTEGVMKLIQHPGSRVRAFDDFNPKIEDRFPENTAAGEYIRHPTEKINMFSPPYTEEKTSVIFKQLKALDDDIMEHPDFKEVIRHVDEAIDKMTGEDLKNAIEDMHLKTPTPDNEEEMKALLKASVKNDLVSAYRFKCISSPTYLKSPHANGRLKDFMQAYNTAYRDNPNDEAKCLEKLSKKAKKELSTRITMGVIISTADPTKLASIESAAKDLVSHKSFDRLGLHAATELIKESLKDDKFKDVSETEKNNLVEFVKSAQTLRGQLHAETNPEHRNRELSETIKLLTEHESYKKFSDKSIADSILLDEIDSLADSDYKEDLKTEFSKAVLMNAINKAVESLDLTNKTPDQIERITRSAIDDLRGNKAFINLGDDHASEVFVIAMNSIDDPAKKTAVENDFLRRFEVSVARSLKDNNLNASEKIQSILNDKYLPYLDQEKARNAVFQQIAGLEGASKTDKNELLGKLNQHYGTNYELPKSGFEKFAENAGNFFKKLGKNTRNAFKKLGKRLFGAGGAHQSPQEMPMSNISSPTVSEETKQNILKEHDAIPVHQAELMFAGDMERRHTNRETFIKLVQQCITLCNELKTNKAESHDFNYRQEQLMIKLLTLHEKLEVDLKDAKISPKEFADMDEKIKQVQGKVDKLGKIYDHLVEKSQEPKPTEIDVAPRKDLGQEPQQPTMH